MARNRPHPDNPWVPEIICFDYDLMGMTESVEQRLIHGWGDDGSLYRKLSPLPDLRRRTPALEDGEPSQPPVRQRERGYDLSGCYVGGTLLLTFADHPCSPVPFTRHGPESIRGTDAEFFEWLIEREADHTFAERGGKWETWQEFLVTALPRLRARIRRLATQGRVRVSLTDVLRLSEADEESLEDQGLTLQSRFGRRTLSIAGLWADLPIDERARSVRDWATDLLAGVSPKSEGPTPGGGVLLTEAVRLADHIWYDGYCSHLVEDREALSKLAKSGNNLSGDEAERYRELSQTFGVVDDACTRNCVALDHSTAPDRVKRWAALLLMTRFVAEWAKFSQQETGELSLPLIPFSAWDLLLLFNPLPATPLVLFHHQENADVSSNSWSKKMSRWSDRNQSIKMKPHRVLDGSELLLPGEAVLLRHYSQGLGLDSAAHPDVFFWESEHG